MSAECERKFWRLLTDYETLVYQQAVAIRHGDMRLITETQHLKTAIFSTWIQLGVSLHINRSTNPELNRRLTDLTLLESANDHRLEASRELTTRRLIELEQTRQRLAHIRRNYQETEIPAETTTRFAARG